MFIFFVPVRSYCMSCRKQFHSPEFARFPNGIVVHPECAGGSPGSPARVCPVTGRIFSTEKGGGGKKT